MTIRGWVWWRVVLVGVAALACPFTAAVLAVALMRFAAWLLGRPLVTDSEPVLLVVVMSSLLGVCGSAALVWCWLHYTDEEQKAERAAEHAAALRARREAREALDEANRRVNAANRVESAVNHRVEQVVRNADVLRAAVDRVARDAAGMVESGG